MDTLAVTVPIKPCRSCGSAVPESDRFCRLCGESQSPGQTIALQGSAEPRDLQDLDSASTAAQRVSGPWIGSEQAHPMEGPISSRLVSGPVVWALSRTGTGAANSYAPRMKRIVSILISIPVWLIILLLSPFDAYRAARLIAESRWQ